MEVIVPGKAVVLDAREIINLSYDGFITLPCSSRPEEPYQVHREDKIDITKDEATASQRKRKRKRTEYIPNQPEQDFHARHMTIEPNLSQALEHLKEWMQEKNINTISSAFGLTTQAKNPDLTSHQGIPRPSENEIPDILSSIDFVSLAAMRRVIKPNFIWLDDLEDSKPLHLYNQLISNEQDTEQEAIAFDHNVLIPGNSHFLMSDMNCLDPLLKNYKNALQCMVIDPPWENRSVQRSSSSSSYQMLPNKTLLSLPVRALASKSGCLVALWVTNREKLRKFIEEELLEAWGLRHVATWHWLKVAGNGQPTTPLVS